MPTYQKHQRDYTLLGTSVVFEAYCNRVTRAYFSYDPQPMYVLVESGLLYHFTAEEDSRARATHWTTRYTLDELRTHKRQHDTLLTAYRSFLSEEHPNISESLLVLHRYFAELLPLILAAIEVPEYGGDALSQDVLDFCMQIRKENEDVYKVGFDTQGHLLRRLEERDGLAAQTLCYLTQNECQKYIQSSELPGRITERKNFVFIEQSIDGERVFLERARLKELGLMENTDISASQDISGKVAFAGCVRGKVRVIRFVEEAARLEEGEILVTGMTDPRYVAVMKKAAAIVTDEGGITCHAAIVSRELQKPCIIGTKIATKVLKDGDEIEVDANVGIVKMIKRIS